MEDENKVTFSSIPGKEKCEEENNRKKSESTFHGEVADASEITGNHAVRNSRGNIHCLTIIGQIEGHIILPPQNKTTK
mgnify:CR=1 FL=1